IVRTSSYTTFMLKLLIFFFFFFFNAPSTTLIYTLSLHDALPIFRPDSPADTRYRRRRHRREAICECPRALELPSPSWKTAIQWRSEEHTSELQSLAYLVCRLLLEKKKQKKNNHTSKNTHYSHHVT